MTEQLKALAKAASKPTARMGEHYDYQHYATPKRILALLAENERLIQANVDLTTTLRMAARRRADPDPGMEILKL